MPATFTNSSSWEFSHVRRHFFLLMLKKIFYSSRVCGTDATILWQLRGLIPIQKKPSLPILLLFSIARFHATWVYVKPLNACLNESMHPPPTLPPSTWNELTPFSPGQQPARVKIITCCALHNVSSGLWANGNHLQVGTDLIRSLIASLI